MECGSRSFSVKIGELRCSRGPKRNQNKIQPKDFPFFLERVTSDHMREKKLHIKGEEANQKLQGENSRSWMLVEKLFALSSMEQIFLREIAKSIQTLRIHF